MRQRSSLTLVPAMTIIVALSTTLAAGEPVGRSCLLVVMDGLRPDYVTAELMPRLYAFAEEGVVAEHHHSVFPTVTRVNATSISTGTYPAVHGILGNTIYVPEFNPRKGISTGNATALMQADQALGGQLVTATTLGQLLEGRGLRLLVTSSGSTGSAFLLNHRVSSGAILNSELTLPETLAPYVLDVFGPAPPEAEPGTPRTRRAVDAYLTFGLETFRPAATVIWMTDPDHTAHEAGIGTPLMKQALSEVDAEFGRILDTLEEKGLRNQVNILVASDHGFSTQTGEMDLAGLLQKHGLKAGPDSDEVIVVEGSLYVKDHDKTRIEAIVRVLQTTPWVGAIFTRASEPGSPVGSVAGTLSLAAALGDHPRAGDILVSANWSHEANAHGFRGTTALTGVAGHGTSSPHDIHAVLIASGPDFKIRARSSVPTGNIDLAPTLCRLLGVPPAETMRGRALTELLRDGPDFAAVEVREQAHQAERIWEGGRYHLLLHASCVDATTYIDYTVVTR